MYCDLTKNSWLARFLRFAKKTDTLPDIVSWHEMGSTVGQGGAEGDFAGQTIPEHAAAVRKFLAAEGMASRIKSLAINEFMPLATWSAPGPTLAFLASIERGCSGVRERCVRLPTA